MHRHVMQLYKDRSSWCLSFRLCLHPGYRVEDVDPLSEETREAIMREVYNVSMEEELGIRETVDVKNIFHKFFLDQCNIETNEVLDIDNEHVEVGF